MGEDAAGDDLETVRNEISDLSFRLAQLIKVENGTVNDAEAWYLGKQKLISLTQDQRKAAAEETKEFYYLIGYNKLGFDSTTPVHTRDVLKMAVEAIRCGIARQRVKALIIFAHTKAIPMEQFHINMLMDAASGENVMEKVAKTIPGGFYNMGLAYRDN